MKKLMVSVLIGLLSFAGIANADQYSQAYEAGQSITSHAIRIANGGNDNKAFWYDSKYDFNTVKHIILETSIHQNVSDPYLNRTYVDLLNKKFQDTNIRFHEYQDVQKEYQEYLTENSLDPKEYLLWGYIFQKYRTYNVMTVNIYDYNNHPYPGIRTMGNCHVDFKLIDIRKYNPNDPNAAVILFYDDQRLEAVNASRGGLLDRITGRFKSKFNDALNKKPISE